MKVFMVLGPGCRNCHTTATLIEERAKALGIAVRVEKVTDMATILGHGVLSTPGVMADGLLLHSGSVPSARQVEQWLRQ
ncbi:MAG: thioredoxin family protein [Magnetococcales bacterium]|nr:thioredoxin family protein [Magnetococcales bacterium]